ncbi:hypothetical protein HDZ31DRAFT_34552 [Schizophyllum fasciatum]
MSCKTVSLLALRSLWKTVHEPAVVVKYTMPDDLWVVCESDSTSADSEDDSGDQLVPSRPVTGEDITRLTFYAPFIRRMNFGWNVPLTIAEEGYSALCMACRAPVFPNLTHMGWDVDGLHLIYSRFFLCASLRRMHIVAESLAMGDVAILRSIQQQCPTLSELRVDLDTATDALAKALSETFCAWDLRQLQTSHVDQSGLVRLADSAQLEVLEVQTAEGLQPMTRPVNFPRASFAALTIFVLALPISLAACIDMLSQSAFTSLHTLSLRALTSCPERWGALFAAIRKAHTNPRVLRELVLRDAVTDTDLATSKGPEPEDVPDSRFAPLYDFVGLEVVYLSAQEGFRLSDHIIESMAQAWPDVRELRFEHRSRLLHPQLPLRSLAHLAAGCRRLETLEIDVNATGVSLAHAPLAPWTAQSALHTLRVNWSTIKSARPVAAYLSTLFSDIKQLDSVSRHMDGLGDVHCPHWIKVFYLLPAFTAIQEYAQNSESGRWKEFSDGAFDGADDGEV